LQSGAILLKHPLSTSNLVSFKPYLDRLQKLLNNQHYLVFNPIQGKKDSLQRVNIQTATKNSEILAPDNVWVPGAAKTANSKTGE
jgi:hypothetical protein